MNKSNLEKLYNNDLVPSLLKELGISNKMEVPKLMKIVLNMGLGEAKDNKNSFQQAVEEMTLITGQKPMIRKAKKAISNFKIRQNDPIGISVTLRRKMMYEFLERFIAIVSPRIRDFRGLSSQSFDKFGNFSFGIKEHVIFPEVNFDKVEKIRGLDITIVTHGKNKNHTLALLEEFNFPFSKEKRFEF